MRGLSKTTPIKTTIEQTATIHNQTNTQTQTNQIANTNIVQSKNIETISTIKTFYQSGKIKSDSQLKTVILADRHFNFDSNTNMSQTKLERTETKIDTKSTAVYQSDWGINAMYRPSLFCLTHFCPDNLKLGLSKNLIGNLFLVGNTNYKFNEAEIGFSYFLH